ncbi:MAG TPA: hypothetical protein VFB96_09320 [Pirellulaceae bacterium]|nr:hypothetical protein [Pirellulaceae bacterium]
MLLDRKHFSPLHRNWLATVILVTIASAAWFAWTWWRSGRNPGGGSWTGLAFGIAAALICLFEMALVIRKTRWFRARRTLLGIPLGTARAWMAAHIWLGLLAVPLVAMHAGLRFGGTLSWLLAWLFIVVIVSGVVGLTLQNVLPRLLTEAVPDETIYSQIDVVGSQLAADAARLARLYGGPPPEEWAELEQASASRPSPTAEGVIAGAPRRVGTMVERSPHPEVNLPRGADSPDLHRAVKQEVAEFLRTGRSSTGKLGSAQQIQWFFDDLRRRVRPEARPAVDQIEDLCRRRRQFNLQVWIHFWLHSWLSIHLPLSVALIWLLAAHIVGAIAYN